MTEKQKTIDKPVKLSGIGLHTGKQINLTLKPAPVNSGIVFVRTDIENMPPVPADIDNVYSTARGTNLSQNGVCVNTVEHVLAALSGLGIDNITIELNGPEVPIMDGSARPFVDSILSAGIKEQNQERKYYEIKSNVVYSSNNGEHEILAMPADDFKVTVLIDYNSSVLGPQHAVLEHITDFKDHFSVCRTFVFIDEIEGLLQSGLIKGGDLSNAILISDRQVTDEELDHLAKLFNKPKTDVNRQGIINNEKLKCHNEPARHKLIDIIGDLALVGMPIKGHIIAKKPGHTLNVEFAKKIRQLIKTDLKNGIPYYNIHAPAVVDVKGIMQLLPHRPPFLLVDKIIEMTDTYIVGLKNVTMNEDFFKGHFPGNPIMPGVLIIEAMAQTGGVLALKTVPDPENYETYFLKIDSVRFKKAVVPGDTLVFKLELIEPIRRGIVHMKGTAYVGNKLTTEADMMAIIQRVKTQK
ncbi:MAG: bifunctional UDP-3-O-[3-hydroxymyristoyl] N-acetylglucosamine deacetylase/3-hydroxyacyl-ACP dehydratase [Bacteroidetes bacterium]|nr:bifunctional UDP-3-O-[3-hydroxymyristoyl] N-acetylglucosamine deacetylase/3-hydroxyacyl-ACP dehydratase [Bacteroidota bacterium]